jgi:hypothetical protein
MLGAVFAHAVPPDASGKKRSPKPKTNSMRKTGHKVTKGEGSMNQPHQQHGELATAMSPKPLSDRQMEKESAKSSMRRATANWVDGHISAKEHSAIHSRARHVLAGKHRR